MANNYCSFSFIVECSNEKSAEALVKKIDSAMETEDWFCLEILERDGNCVHIAEGEGADLQVLADVLQSYLEEWNPTGHIGFTWADHCSKLRPDEFGGGAVFITVKGQDWLNSSEWLYTMTKEHNKSLLAI